MSATAENLAERRDASPGAFARLNGLMDRIYLWAGYTAGAAMVIVFAITIVQIVLRWFGTAWHGSTSYAGYFLAASTFLAFAHTFNHGAHVRIGMFLAMFGRWKMAGEFLAFAISTGIVGWFTWYAWDMVYWSYTLGDLSTELDATPLWIPQSVMAIGLTLFAISITDHGLRLMINGAHGIPDSPDAL
jgi:TRAP-type C4-dicarboxylate transport system permease small subunit